MLHEYQYTHSISNEEKLSHDYAYYKYWANYYRSSNADDFDRMEFNEKIAHGELDMAVLQKVWNPHNKTETFNIPTDFRHKDILSATLNRLSGIESTKKFKSTLTAINSEANNRRRDLTRRLYNDMVEQNILAEVKQTVEKSIPKDAPNRPEIVTQQIELNTPERIQKYVQRDYVDPAEVIGNHIKNYLIQEEDVNVKFMLNAKNAFIHGKYIYYTGIENGKSILRLVDPRCFTYTKSKDTPFISEFDSATIHYRISPDTIISYWGELLDDTKIRDIYRTDYSYSSGATKAFAAFEPIFSGFENNRIEGSQYVTHSIWRALTKMTILTYVNEEGIITKDRVSSDYILNKNNGDISITYKLVPELHECILLGEDFIIKAGPVLDQPVDLDNIYNIPLPFKGVILNEYNGKAKSIVDYQINYAILYDIILYRVEEFMRQDKGKLLLLNEDLINLEIDKWFDYAEKNNIAFFSFADTTAKFGNKDINSLAKEIDRSQIDKINSYIQLADYVENKVKSIVGINPQFEGQIEEREGQRNVEKAVDSTALALEPTFYLMNYVKNEVVHSMVYNQIRCFINNKTDVLTYTTDDVGILMIELDPQLLMESRFTTFMENGAKQEKIIDVLTRYAEAKAQNNALELSALGRFLMQDNINDALEILGISEAKAQKQAQELESQRASNDSALLDKKFEQEMMVKEVEQVNELEQIQAKGEMEILKATIVGSGFAEDKDINDNSVPDILEISKQLLEQEKFAYQKKKDMRDEELTKRKIDVDKIKATRKSS